MNVAETWTVYGRDGKDIAIFFSFAWGQAFAEYYGLSIRENEK